MNINPNIKIISTKTLYDKNIWEFEVRCERGFGNSFAMFIRTALMSKLPSYRVVAVKARVRKTSDKDHVGNFTIAKNKFSTLSGVRNSLLQIISNLQHCVFVPNSELLEEGQEPSLQLSLRFKGPGVVLASHFEPCQEVKIINAEDVEITSVDPGYTFDLSIQLGYGIGFVEEGRQDIKDLDSGFFALPMKDVIKINSFHSDVEAVTATVIPTEEQDIIHCTVESSLAFSNPEKILKFIFEYILQLTMPLAGYNLNELLEEVGEGNKEAPEEFVAIESNMLDHSIRVIKSLGGRASNLESAGIKTIRDLINTSEQKLLFIENVGSGSIKKINSYLNKVGLRLKEDYEE
jgi:DNA-directed RNA polymerase alpha subunit